MAAPNINIEDLHRKWYKPVRSWIRKRGNIPKLWVEDIAQEVFMRLLRYDPEINSNPTGYVFRTASNIANEWMERSHLKKTHGKLEDLGEDALGTVGPLDEMLEEHETRQERQLRVELAMSKIKGRKLLVLMFHMYEEKTYGQIATALGLSYRTVLRDLTSAYSQLRIELADMTDIYTPDEGIKDEQTDGEPGRVQGVAGTQHAGGRSAPHGVGAPDRVHRARTSRRRLSSSGSV